MRGIWQDVRYASRVVRAHPVAVAIAVLSLALGVGANTIVFSLVDGMFLRPLPVSDPTSLVRIEWQSVDGRTSAMAWADQQTLRESGGAFAEVAAQNRRGGLLDTGGDVELTLVTIVSDNYFPLLGIEPAICFQTLTSAMIADLVEQSELKTGRRSEGIFFAANSFIRKMVTGIGVSMAAFVLASAGIETGATPAETSPEAIWRLGAIYVPAILALWLAMMAATAFYKIERADHESNLRELAARKEAR